MGLLDAFDNEEYGIQFNLGDDDEEKKMPEEIEVKWCAEMLKNAEDSGDEKSDGNLNIDLI